MAIDKKKLALVGATIAGLGAIALISQAKAVAPPKKPPEKPPVPPTVAWFGAADCVKLIDMTGNEIPLVEHEQDFGIAFQYTSKDEEKVYDVKLICQIKDAKGQVVRIGMTKHTVIPLGSVQMTLYVIGGLDAGNYVAETFIWDAKTNEPLGEQGTLPFSVA
jgi:hypothetical protein